MGRGQARSTLAGRANRCGWSWGHDGRMYISRDTTAVTCIGAAENSTARLIPLACLQLLPPFFLVIPLLPLHSLRCAPHRYSFYLYPSPLPPATRFTALFFSTFLPRPSAAASAPLYPACATATQRHSSAAAHVSQSNHPSPLSTTNLNRPPLRSPDTAFVRPVRVNST